MQQARDVSRDGLVIDRITRSLEKKLAAHDLGKIQLAELKTTRSKSSNNLKSSLSLRQVLESVKNECFGVDSEQQEGFMPSRLKRLGLNLPELQTRRSIHHNAAPAIVSDMVMENLKKQIKDVKTLENLIKHKRSNTDLTQKTNKMLSGELLKVSMMAKNMASTTDGPAKEVFKLIAKHIKFANKMQAAHNIQNKGGIFGKSLATSKDTLQPGENKEGAPEMSQSFYSKSEYAQDNELLLELYKKSNLMFQDSKKTDLQPSKRTESLNSQQLLDGKSRADSDSIDMDQMIAFKPTSHKDEGSEKASIMNDDDYSQTSQNQHLRPQLPGGVFNRTTGALLSPPPSAKKKKFPGFFANTKHLGKPVVEKVDKSKPQRSPTGLESLRSSNFTEVGLAPKIQHAASLGDSGPHYQRFKRQSSNPVLAIDSFKKDSSLNVDNNIRRRPSVVSLASAKDKEEKQSSTGSDKLYRKTYGSQMTIKITPPTPTPASNPPIKKAMSTGNLIDIDMGGNLIPKSRQVRSPKRIQVDLTVPQDNVIRETEEEDNRTATYISVRESAKNTGGPYRQESMDFNDARTPTQQVHLFKDDTTEQSRTKARFLTLPQSPKEPEAFGESLKPRPRSRGATMPKIIVNYAPEEEEGDKGSKGTMDLKPIPRLETIKQLQQGKSSTHQETAKASVGNQQKSETPIQATVAVPAAISATSGSESNWNEKLSAKKATLELPDDSSKADNIFQPEPAEGQASGYVQSVQTGSFAKWDSNGLEGSKMTGVQAGSLTEFISERRIVKKIDLRKQRPPVESDSIRQNGTLGYSSAGTAHFAQQNVNVGSLSSLKRKKEVFVGKSDIESKQACHRWPKFQPHSGIRRLG